MAEATTVTPHICCRNAMEAVEYYQKAFGAEPVMVMKSPSGQLMHAAISIDGATVMIGGEWPEFGALSPQALGNSPVTLHLQVADCDAVFQRAAEAGCTVAMPLQDMFWGARYGVLIDPYGHKWSIATTVKEMTPQEMQAAATAALSQESGCGQTQ